MKRGRWVLMNPGPVNVTPAVRRALLGPDICHREPEFTALLKRLRARLLSLFHVQKTHTAAILSGSGTLAVEAMLSSYARCGRKVLVLSNGVYGKRLAAILVAHRAPHAVLSAPLGDFPSTAALRATLQKDKRIGAVAMVHHETSTGMLNPLAEVARIVRAAGRDFLVDAVSSLGAEKLDLDKMGIDFCAGSAGKCLHGYPGAAFVLVSRKKLPLLRAGTARSVYLDLASILDSEDAGAPPFTPAVQLLYAFDAALAELERESVARRIASYVQKSAIIERGLERIGIRLLVPRHFRSHVLTAAWLPPFVSYEELHAELKKKGFVIYAGQSELRDRIFRAANLGDIRPAELKRFVAAVDRVAKDALRKAPKAVVLAAGVGRRFGAHTTVLPKSLIPLGKGQTLLGRYLDAFRACGIRHVTVVVGHQHRLIRKFCAAHGRGLKIKFLYNKDYRLGSVLSLHRAGAEFDRDILVMDADVYFPAPALERLLRAPQKTAFLADTSAHSTGEEMIITARDGRPVAISKKPDTRLKSLGEATGIVKFSREDARTLLAALKDLKRKGLVKVEYEEAYSRMMKRVSFGVVPTEGFFWTEMDFEADLKKIRTHLKSSL